MDNKMYYKKDAKITKKEHSFCVLAGVMLATSVISASVLFGCKHTFIAVLGMWVIFFATAHLAKLNKKGRMILLSLTTIFSVLSFLFDI